MAEGKVRFTDASDPAPVAAGAPSGSAPAAAAGDVCWVCKKSKIEYAPTSCGHAVYCKKCAMKMASGGKCKKCGKLFADLRRAAPS